MTNDISSAGRPSRRALLKTAGAVGVAAAGGVLGRQVFSPAIAAPAPKIRLAWTEVAACHSPLGFGVARGICAKHNLDVELFFRRLLHGDSARVRSGSIQKRSWPRIFVSDPTDASAPSIGLERY